MGRAEAFLVGCSLVKNRVDFSLATGHDRIYIGCPGLDNDKIAESLIKLGFRKDEYDFFYFDV